MSVRMAREHSFNGRSSRSPRTAGLLPFVEPCGRWHPRLTAYIVREHRRGRSLSEILADRFVVEHASAAAIAHLLEDPRLIERLRDDCVRPLSVLPDAIVQGGSDGSELRGRQPRPRSGSSLPAFEERSRAGTANGR